MLFTNMYSSLKYLTNMRQTCTHYGMKSTEVQTLGELRTRGTSKFEEFERELPEAFPNNMQSSWKHVIVMEMI